jgi:hypothetical protein
MSAGWTTNLIEAGRAEPGERVLVVVDEPLTAEGEELTEALRAAGAVPRLELWAASERPMAHPPAPVLEAARESTLCLFLLQQPLGAEANARFELAETMAGRGREIYLGLVRGEAGTDLTLRVGDRPWLTDALPLQRGAIANFPGGEVFVAPHRDGADGVLVADLTVPYTVDGLVDEPVRLEFAGGRVTSIEGGRAAAMLRELVDGAGEGADVIAELGLGLNPTVRPRGHAMLDEKAAGTGHVAIGRNTGAYGGDNEATIHVDMVFSAPQVEADGRRIELP